MTNPTKNQDQRLDEGLLMDIADGTVDVEIPRDGHPFPEGFINPASGSTGHRCVDPKGNYRKSWYCLKIHKSDGMPTRQHFNCAGRKYNVLVGSFVDVPPEIVEVMAMCVVQEIRHGYNLSDGLGEVNARMIVSETPRFSYSVISSF